MANRLNVAPVMLACLVAQVALNSGCGTSSVESPARAGSPAIARVATIVPERMTIRRITEQPGQIEAIEVTPIHAKLTGYVKSVSADIGDRVKKGQVLAELHVPEVEADLKQKRAMVEQAQAEARQSEASLAVAKAGVASAEAKVFEIQAGIRRAESDVTRWQSEFARVQQLAQERALTGSLVDETRSKLGAAQASLDEVKAKVKSSEAALAESRALLDKARSDIVAAISHIDVARFEAERADAMASYRKLEAPFDGVVTRRKVDTGQLITPGNGVDPLFVVARADLVTIAVGVPEADAPFVNPGDPAQVRLLALDDRKFDGKVTRTAWALENSTRTLLAEIDLASPNDLLRPGLYAYATINAEEHKNALTLPTTAIIKDAGKAFCVTVKDKVARRKEIKLGLTEGKRTEVLSGLSEGEAVVEANSSSLVDGQAVEQIAPPTSAVPKPKS